MQAVVRSFRSHVIEGRFVSAIASLVVIGMRAALFFLDERSPAVYRDNGYLWQYVAPWFADPMVSLIASTLSVFMIAFLISEINRRFTLIRTRSSLPFVVPLFLLSLHPWFLTMTGDYIAVIFILAAFFPLLESYQTPDATLYSFRSAVLTGVASLFQIEALVLLPLWWRGQYSMHGLQFRSFLSSLFGLLLVYVSLFSIYFFVDDLSGFVLPFLSFASFSLPDMPDFTWPEWVAVVLTGLFFISGMILSISACSRDKVLTLIFIHFVAFLVIFLMLLQILYWEETLFFLTLSIPLISYLHAYFYTKTGSAAFIFLAGLIVLLLLGFYFSHFLR